MKSTIRASIDLSRALPLPDYTNSLPWYGDLVGDDAEQTFEEGTTGLSSDIREHLRELAVRAALVQTTDHFVQMCETLGGKKGAGKARSAVLRASEVGLNHCDVDTRDVVRAALTLLSIVPPVEIDDLVQTCVSYGKEAARPLISKICATWRGTPYGEALRQAYGLTTESQRKSAARAGVSPAALSKMKQRISANSHCRG